MSIEEKVRLACQYLSIFHTHEMTLAIIGIILTLGCLWLYVIFSDKHKKKTSFIMFMGVCLGMFCVVISAVLYAPAESHAQNLQSINVNKSIVKAHQQIPLLQVKVRHIRKNSRFVHSNKLNERYYHDKYQEAKDKNILKDYQPKAPMIKYKF